MENYGGLPINSPEIEPLELETYVTLEQSILDEIIHHAQKDQIDGPIVNKYLRISSIDAEVECVDVILAGNVASSSGVARRSYTITVYQYRQEASLDEDAKRQSSDVDAHTYVLSIDNKTLSCYMYADLASGTRIGRHRMNAVEHSMLLDELLAVHTWQLAAHQERAILKQ